MRVRLSLGGAILICMLVGSALGSGTRGLAETAPLQYLPPELASSLVVASDALQCSLLDTATQNGAGVLGQDGGFSYVQNGSIYWEWSDTFISKDPGYIPNSVASSQLQAPQMPQAGASAADTGCFPMQYKTAASGAADAMLPAPAPNCADWPTQLVAPDAASSTLYFIYVRHAPSHGTEPCALPGGAGIGALDTTTMTATRLDDQPTWIETPGQPVQITDGMALRTDDGDGEYIYMFLVAGGDRDPLGSTTAVALARVRPADFPSPSLYRYWTGSDWVPWDTFKSLSPEDNAHFLWRQPDFGIQAGMKVSYLAHLHKWVAVYATRLAEEVRVRTADHLTGPWSNESQIVDCRAQLAELPAPMSGVADWPCYSAMIHDELTSPDGLTIYVSFARNNAPGDYRVYLRRFNLASPIYDWLDASGARALLPGSVTGQGTLQGLAFFASETPLPGYLPIYAFTAQSSSTPDRMYLPRTTPPTGYVLEGIAFYAPQANVSPSVGERIVPVHAVLLPNGQHAYTIGTVPAGATDLGAPFSAIAPNPDVDADGVANPVDNCVRDPNPEQRDTDGDGAGDACDLDDDNDNVPDMQLVDAPFPFAPLDNCPTAPNTDQLDTDNDGLGDACERADYGTDPAQTDTDGDGCGDGAELRLGLHPLDPYDFYSVPVPALLDAPDGMANKDGSVGASDSQAVLAYFKVGAKAGSPAYEADLNHNGIRDGLEYDRSVVGAGMSGPPDGVVSARDAMLAYTQFKASYLC